MKMKMPAGRGTNPASQPLTKLVHVRCFLHPSSEEDDSDDSDPDSDLDSTEDEDEADKEASERRRQRRRTSEEGESAEEELSDPEAEETRRRKRKRSRKRRQKQLEDDIANYYSVTHYGATAASYMFQLAAQLDQKTNKLLWWNIVALTDYYVQERYTGDKYQEKVEELQNEVGRLNVDPESMLDDDGNSIDRTGLPGAQPNPQPWTTRKNKDKNKSERKREKSLPRSQLVHLHAMEPRLLCFVWRPAARLIAELTTVLL